MKTVYYFIIGVMLISISVGCRDRAAEKKIAELENRLAQIENKTTPGTTPANPAIPPAVPVVADEKPTGPLPVAEYSELEHDFGTVTEGEKVSFEYRVKNTGQAPLIIQGAQPSCGCTVPDWSKNPIAVGKAGFVKAEFDTHGKSGAQNKSITVTSNTWPKTTILKFKGMVMAKAK
jgi:Protein of unknown function (DUF1573)